MINKKFRGLVLTGLLALSVLTGCNDKGSDTSTTPVSATETPTESVSVVTQTNIPSTTKTPATEPTESVEPTDTSVDPVEPHFPDVPVTEPIDTENGTLTFKADGIVITVPEYSGKPYVNLNNKVASALLDLEYNDIHNIQSSEYYSPLDDLGRCGECIAYIGTDLQPTDKRGDIGSVQPSGWKYNGKSNNNKYDFVDGLYIYNRCHLIGYQLTAENANERNLVTGTRYLNIDGMLWLENLCDDYFEADINKYNHIYYRVIPVFMDDELVCRGLVIRAYSIEDNEGTDGDMGINECIFAYNVQPDVKIDYKTGQNWLDEDDKPVVTETPQTQTFILNTKSKKYHCGECSGVKAMSEKNKQIYEGTVAELEAQGYEPCGICYPD